MRPTNAGKIKTRPIRGKEASVTARLTPEVREALEKSAEEAGRSLGSELEILLRSALRARAAAANQIDTLFELGWKAARRVIEDAGGLGPANSAHVHAAIHDIITEMLKHLPAPPASEADQVAPEEEKPGSRPINPFSKRPRNIDLDEEIGEDQR